MIAGRESTTGKNHKEHRYPLRSQSVPPRALEKINVVLMKSRPMQNGIISMYTFEIIIQVLIGVRARRKRW
jgi:hypothetical protein